MRIYEIDQAILDLMDSETGEVLDVERLESLQIERDAKIENLALWYKQLIAEYEAIRFEFDRLQERMSKKGRKADSLARYLAQILDGKKFERPRVSIGWRTAESVNILDEAAIDSRYIEVTETRRIDRIGIRKAIKSGFPVPGAEITKTRHIQIN